MAWGSPAPRSASRKLRCTRRRASFERIVMWSESPPSGAAMRKIRWAGPPAPGEGHSGGAPGQPFDEGLPAGTAPRQEPGEQGVAGADGADRRVDVRLAVQRPGGVDEDRPVSAEAGKDGPGPFLLKAP